MTAHNDPAFTFRASKQTEALPTIDLTASDEEQEKTFVQPSFSRSDRPATALLSAVPSSSSPHKHSPLPPTTSPTALALLHSSFFPDDDTSQKEEDDESTIPIQNHHHYLHSSSQSPESGTYAATTLRWVSLEELRSHLLDQNETQLRQVLMELAARHPNLAAEMLTLLRAESGEGVDFELLLKKLEQAIAEVESGRKRTPHTAAPLETALSTCLALAQNTESDAEALEVIAITINKLTKEWKRLSLLVPDPSNHTNLSALMTLLQETFPQRLRDYWQNATRGRQSARNKASENCHFLHHIHKLITEHEDRFGLLRQLDLTELYAILSRCSPSNSTKAPAPEKRRSPEADSIERHNGNPQSPAKKKIRPTTTHNNKPDNAAARVVGGWFRHATSNAKTKREGESTTVPQEKQFAATDIILLLTQGDAKVNGYTEQEILRRLSNDCSLFPSEESACQLRKLLDMMQKSGAIYRNKDERFMLL
ncbi:hypothetical protein QOT17_010924 [Balamuthia mandrillaris]